MSSNEAGYAGSQAFPAALAEQRAVRIPAGLAPDARLRFVAKLAAAARRQAALAEQSEAVLRVTGEPLEREDYVIIPHERAAPAETAAVAGDGPRPDIDTLWWLTWSGLRALAAAAGERVCHGGIQPGVVFLDETGRIKLGDFGIAPTFEAVCGIDQRRQVLYAAGGPPELAGGPFSGTWRLAREDEPYEHGWIAPYFAHELLEGTVRLNCRADQFALGVLLYLWATGTHPYGAGLSDPSLMCYFHLEPFALEEERAAWRECFERQAKELARDADRPVLNWWNLLRRLLAADPGQRYADLAEAERLAQQTVPAEWARGAAAVSQAVRLLEAGEVTGCLRLLEPWRAAPVLPELWRARLDPWVAQLEARKDAIVRHQRLERRLAEGQAALDDLELEAARAAAREVLQGAEPGDALRGRAEELLRFCDEQEEFIRSGADSLSQQYLESARAALAHNDFPEARACLNAILQDPATPSARAARARHLVAEVELAEQRLEQRLAELETARAELAAGHFAAAQQRAEALLTQEDPAGATTAQARQLLDEVRRAQTRRAEYAAALNEARDAWERADLQTLEQRLSGVPERFADPQITDLRRDLAGRCAPLRRALAARAAAGSLLAGGDQPAARSELEQALRACDLPQLLQDELAALLERCERAAAQARQAAIEAARAALEQAEQAYAAADDAQCQRKLENDVLTCAHLPDPARARAERLLELCAALRAARAGNEQAGRCLAQGDAERAAALLDALPPTPLPESVAAETKRLREQARAAQREFVRRQRAALRRRLESASAALEAGELDEAQATLDELERSRFLSDGLRARIAAGRAAIDRQRPVLATLAAAEAALDRDEPALGSVSRTLERLPAELPAWAGQRLAALRRRMGEIEARRRELALRRARAALDAARQALADGDTAAAREHLAAAGQGAALEPAVARDCEQLGALLEQLEAWLPRVAALRAELASGRPAAVQRQARELLKTAAIPEQAARSLRGLVHEAERRIAGRRRQIDTELEGLAAELERRGRRARRFAARLAALENDPLASAAHKRRAQDLRRRFEALPPPRRARLPLAVAATIGAISLGWAGWYLTRGSQEPGAPRPAGSPPPASVAETAAAQIGAALSRLSSELDSARAAARAAQRPAPGWRLSFQPPDRFPTTLIAEQEAGGGRATLARVASAAELAELALGPETLQTLFPAPPPGPSAREIAAARQKLQDAVDAARAAAQRPGAEAPRYVIGFDPPDSVPADIYARDESSGQQIRLGTLVQAELAGLTLRDEWRARLYPPPSARQLAQEYLAALRAALPAGITDAELRPAGQDRYAVGLSWDGHALHPFAPLGFDRAQRRYAPPAAQAARFFRAQIAGWRALAEPQRLRIELDRTYDAAVQLVPEGPAAKVVAVDAQRNSVTVAGAARLARDPRPAARFPFRGELAGGVLTADQPTRLAFARYLRELQRQQLERAAGALAGTLGLGRDVTVRLPPAFEGGQRASATIEVAGGPPLAELSLSWNAGSLTYEWDRRRAVGQLRAGLARWAGRPGTRRLLAASWPELRRLLAPPAGAPGAQYFRDCELRGVSAAEQQPAELAALAVQVTVGRPGAPAEERLRFVALLRISAGKLAWGTQRLAQARAAVAAALSALAEDRGLRQRRQAAALRELAAELGVSPEAFAARAAGGQLAAQASIKGRTRRFRWEWDAAALRYARRAELKAAAPRTLAERLAALAASSAPEVGEFVSVLGEVARAKVARFGAAGYGVAPELLAPEGEAAARLVALSRALQALTAPDPGVDPFPVVFLEHFITPTQVYGLGWRVATDAQDRITEVTATKVWPVLPTRQLLSHRDPASFRAEYVQDEGLGEGLLGRILGQRLTASARPGEGSFGVLIAPDGPLWLTRWEQVRFRPRAVENLGRRQAPAVGRVSRLREILAPAELGDPDSARRRAGVWCVPTLAGRCQGAAEGLELNLGVLTPGKGGARRAVFMKSANGLVFAPIEVPDLAGDLGWWLDFEQRVRRADIGCRFWDSGWRGARWQQTPFASFSLIQLGQ